MKQILLVQSSPRGSASVSRKVAQDLLHRLTESMADREIKVVERELSANPLPHVGGEQVAAYFTPVDQRTPQTQELLKQSDEAVSELIASDVIILATPVWNFSIPSNLKAWIDHVVRAGKTFSYGAGGPKGLLENKRVYVVVSSGSVFSEGPYKAYDFVEPYLRAVFGFIGVHDLRVIRAEGLSDPKAAAEALKKTEEQLRQAV